jgi:hypothetical protein
MNSFLEATSRFKCKTEKDKKEKEKRKTYVRKTNFINRNISRLFNFNKCINLFKDREETKRKDESGDFCNS